MKYNYRIILWVFFLTIIANVEFTAFKLLFVFTEYREGLVLNDRLLQQIKPVDLSIPVFILTYGSILFAIAANLKWKNIAHLFSIYLAVNLIRMYCVYTLPLKAPVDTIPLNDWILLNTVYNHQAVSTDLFFSGHVSAIALCAFYTNNRTAKYILLAISCVVGTLLIIQHVHYTIDIVAALLVAWLVVFAFKKWILSNPKPVI